MRTRFWAAALVITLMLIDAWTAGAAAAIATRPVAHDADKGGGGGIQSAAVESGPRPSESLRSNRSR